MERVFKRESSSRRREKRAGSSWDLLKEDRKSRERTTSTNKRERGQKAEGAAKGEPSDRKKAVVINQQLEDLQIAESYDRQFDKLRKQFDEWHSQTLPDNRPLYEKIYQRIGKIFRREQKTGTSDSEYTALDSLKYLLYAMECDSQVTEYEKDYTKHCKSYRTLIDKVAEENRERYASQHSQIDTDCQKYIQQAKIGITYNKETEEYSIADVNERQNVIEKIATGVKAYTDLIAEMITEAREEDKYRHYGEDQVKKIRNKYDVSRKRNIAVLEYNVEGKEGSGWASSGLHTYSSKAITGSTNEPYFEHSYTPSAVPYGNLDAEYKELNWLAEKFNPDHEEVCEISGWIVLKTEREPCISCRGVISQFRRMFPNVNLKVVSWIKK